MNKYIITKLNSMEALVVWSDMKTPDQKMVIDTFSEKMKCHDKQKLARIFNLANPTVVLPADRKYFRIEEESGKVLKNLMKNYL